MNFIWMIAVWCFLLCGFWRLFTSQRDAALAASVAFGLVVLVITEALSAGTLFYFRPLLGAWIAAAVLSSLFYVAAISKVPRTARGPLVPADPLVRACAACIVVILSIVGLTALISPPNNWDAMTYHMARVANWVQHRSVADYPTPILRQLYLGPWAEFAVANIQILAASDRFANLVQFFAMIGNVFGITAIAAKLGASPRGQAISGLFAATIPMLILQASNTQTDCVAAFWVVCAINAGLGLNDRLTKRRSPVTPALAACALGLAFLTKATTAFALAPFVIWILIARYREAGRVAASKLLLTFLILPLLINAGHFYRNHTTFGRFLSPDAETGWYQNSLHTPGAIVSSISRNILSNTGFRGMRSYPTHATKLVQILSGLDPSDPRITYSGTHFVISYTRDEHDAGNPVHLLLGAIAMAAAIFSLKRNPRAGLYAICILCGFFMFCFQLKWQPWITRLQLPMFVIMAPLFGLLMDRISLKSMVWTACGLLFAQSFIYLLYGFPRTLVDPHNVFNTSRADQYFNKRPDLRVPYQQAAALIGRSHPATVALACKGDSWEYAVRSQLPPGTAILHVGVDNQSRLSRSFSPDAQPAFLVQLEEASIPAAYSNYQVIYQRPGIAVWHNRE